MFPEFQVTTDAVIQFWIDKSVPFFNAERWDDLLDQGVGNWVAHSITLTKANAGQQITDDAIMKKVGDIQKSRDASLMLKQADNPYMRTTYGQQYLYYMRYVGAGGTAV
jgi:hypothetical protein